MIERISREQMLLEFAYAASRRGTCDRLHVGAVIARDSRPISAGYGGVPPGEPHCHPSVCDSSKPCTRTLGWHAETNAIKFAGQWRIDIVGADMICTDSPCMVCAEAIKEAKLARLFFDRPYRVKDGIFYLLRHGINVIKVERAQPL